MTQPHPMPPAERAESEPRSDDGIERVEQEVARGDTARTPFLVLSSVAVFVAIVFAVALLIAVLAWVLA